MEHNCADLLRLFRLCFPGIVRAEGAAEGVLSHPDNRILTREAEGRLAAASVFNGNHVLMLCVLPELRGRGIGSALLKETEEAVRAAGYGEILFCDGFSYLTPGVPLGAGYEGNREFFVKRGYAHGWGDEECVDMDCDLSRAAPLPFRVGDRVDGILYRFAGPEDYGAVVSCAEDGHEDFAKYYRRREVYEPGGSTRVLAAFDGDMAVGAIFVENGTEAEGLGSVGCTVVRHAYRRRKIGTNMVKIGTEHLRSLGVPRGFLGYTYTEIIPLYAAAGYGVCMSYFMGRKKLL